jgi:anion-transporting  ArsA/GET3 family ATPase
MFTMSRLLVVAGKGGVGKTTVTAAMARAAADTGLRVLVVTLDSRPGLAALLGDSSGASIGYEGLRIADDLGPRATGLIHLRTITAEEALEDYLATQGMARLAKRLVATGVVGVVSSAAPGIDDLLVLGKLKHLVSLTGPTGAISFLQAPSAMAETVRGGPIRSQAIEVQSMLKDPDRCRVVMVTLAETTPVNEMLQSAEILANKVGVAFTPVVVNGVDVAPEVSELVASGRLVDGVLADAARYRASRCALHAREVDRVDRTVHAGHISLPHIPTAGLDADDVGRLADVIRGQVIRVQMESQ